MSRAEDWERVGGVEIPTWMGVRAGQALPEAYVQITVVVRGGGLEDDSSVTFELEEVTVRDAGQFKIDLEELQPDLYRDFEPSVAMRAQPQRVSLHLDKAPVTGDRVWTITTKEPEADGSAE